METEYAHRILRARLEARDALNDMPAKVWGGDFRGQYACVEALELAAANLRAEVEEADREHSA